MDENPWCCQTVHGNKGVKLLKPWAWAPGSLYNVPARDHHEFHVWETSFSLDPICKLKSVALKTLPNAAVPWRRLHRVSEGEIPQEAERAGVPQPSLATEPCQTSAVFQRAANATIPVGLCLIKTEHLKWPLKATADWRSVQRIENALLQRNIPRTPGNGSSGDRMEPGQQQRMHTSMARDRSFT